jgi:hypothetical protein
MQITRTHTELGEEMLFDRGVYKEVFDGTVEYRVYDHNRCLISQARILMAYATPATDEAFASWIPIAVLPVGDRRLRYPHHLSERHIR